jgi:hypothetical protein
VPLALPVRMTLERHQAIARAKPIGIYISRSKSVIERNLAPEGLITWGPGPLAEVDRHVWIPRGEAKGTQPRIQW